MKKGIKRSLLVLLALGLLFCWGCGKPAAEDDGVLRVLVTSTSEDRLAERVTQSFRQTHPDVPVELEYLPLDAQEQALYLEQLQVEIMAGRGPDVFLITSRTPVFADVEQSIHNGLLLDISAFYDRDDSLPKDGFAPVVRDAGVVDGGRYVLPLNYNFPVLYVDTQQLAAAGLSLDTLGCGLSGLAAVYEKLGEKAVTFDITQLEFFYLPNFFPEVINYENQEVTWEKAQLVQWLTQYRQLHTHTQGEYLPWMGASISEYVGNNNYLGKEGYCVYMGTLEDLVDQVRVAKATGTELAILPVTAADGSVCATVTNLGAISAGTGQPELAYEFLRAFALEENQWENGLGDIVGFLRTGNWPVLLRDSWKVIDEDIYVGALANLKTQTASPERSERKTAMINTEVTAQDYAILDTPIDKVYLPIASRIELMNMARQQLNPTLNPEAASVDVEALAEQMIQTLQWQLLEG